MDNTIENDVKEDEVQELSGDDFSLLFTIPEEIRNLWKTKFGTVFHINFIKQDYIYRNFSFGEYKAIRKKIKEQYPNDIEAGDEAFKEEVQKLCVLWPADYAKRLETGTPSPIPAGIPFLLGDYILAASGFSDQIIPNVITSNS